MQLDIFNGFSIKIILKCAACGHVFLEKKTQIVEYQILIIKSFQTQILHVTYAFINLNIYILCLRTFDFRFR